MAELTRRGILALIPALTVIAIGSRPAKAAPMYAALHVANPDGSCGPEATFGGYERVAIEGIDQPIMFPTCISDGQEIAYLVLSDQPPVRIRTMAVYPNIQPHFTLGVLTAELS